MWVRQIRVTESQEVAPCILYNLSRQYCGNAPLDRVAQLQPEETSERFKRIGFYKRSDTVTSLCVPLCRLPVAIAARRRVLVELFTAHR
jgi:hypothetical protein